MRLAVVDMEVEGPMRSQEPASFVESRSDKPQVVVEDVGICATGDLDDPTGQIRLNGRNRLAASMLGAGVRSPLELR